MLVCVCVCVYSQLYFHSHLLKMYLILIRIQKNSRIQLRSQFLLHLLKIETRWLDEKS